MPGLRGDQVGALVAGAFGLVYVLVNTGTLPAAVAWPLRALALAVFVAVVATILRHRQPADGAAGRRGFGRAYWLVVLVEVVALFGGLRVLAGPLDRPQAGVAWVSLVVGVHFFALAVVFGEPFFHLLGAGVTACGAVGLALALAGSSRTAADTVGGVVPGFLLLAFAVWAAWRARSWRGPPVTATSGGPR